MRIGGTEMVIKNIIEGSNKSHFTMSIFCIEEPLGPWGKQMQEAGTIIASKHRKDGFDFSIVSALRQYIKQHNIDIVHCHQYTPWAYGALACLGLRAKVIFTEHGRFYPDIKSPKRRWINPLLLSVTDDITAISNATAGALAEYEYIPQKQVKVIYNGIAQKQNRATPNAAKQSIIKQSLGINDKTIVIGTIARLDPIKNHLMMLKSVQQLVEKGVDVHFILVGDGECRQQIEQSIEQLKIGKYVSMPGYITEPADYLAIMDIFLLTSFSEGTSMTLLEAMRDQKPCIVTNVGGNPEVIKNDYNGLVIESDDVQGLTDSLRKLISQPELINKMGKSGLNKFNTEFTATKMCNDYAEVYLRLA